MRKLGFSSVPSISVTSSRIVDVTDLDCNPSGTDTAKTGFTATDAKGAKEDQNQNFTAEKRRGEQRRNRIGLGLLPQGALLLLRD
jgi:hypothetical protein